MNKTHFQTDPANSIAVACGRPVNDRAGTPFVDRVTCLACQRKPAFKEAKREDDKRKHARFMAQEPRVIAEPWRDGNMVCSGCGSDRFRIGERTCYGHYQNYHCAECPRIESRLTETGMSF